MPTEKSRSTRLHLQDESEESLTFVLPGLYLGGLENAQSLAASNLHQIRTVITLCQEPVEERSPEITYEHFPVFDSRPIPSELLNRILIAIEGAVKRGATLVHCAAGASRSPLLLAAYLDRSKFRPFRESLAYLADIRSEVAPSVVLAESIVRHLKRSKASRGR